MSKKYVVIHDLDNFPLKKKDGGMYAILPYERIDAKGNALFKVGQADSYNKRFENYHTYYPLGFYYKNLLKNPKKDQTINKKVYYNRIENFIHKDIVKNGGKQLKTTTRVKNSKKNENNLGDTEWFYTNEKTLDKAFKNAHNEFGGDNYKTSGKGINKNADRNIIDADYKGEIYYKFL